MTQQTAETLLSPVAIGNWKLRNRIVMAPMTRSFADDKTGTPGQDMAAYYRRRAADGVGLIITEGISTSLRGKGTYGVPGLYTGEQTAAWRKVTDAVHEEGGTIVAQLWHVGRLTHHELTGGFPPQAPSQVRAEGLVHRLRKPYEMPEEMTRRQIGSVIREYAQAARNAAEAGFDGVEVHGAHGYLIDQFNSEATNKRTDRYGGELTDRLTFMKEVLTAVGQEIGAGNTIIRFSELKDDMPDYKWASPERTLQAYLRVFKETGIRTIHPSTNRFAETMADGQTIHELVRKHWDGAIIGVGGLTVPAAAKAIGEGTIDLAAFGKPMLANPDFVQRIKDGDMMQPYDAAAHLSRLI